MDVFKFILFNVDQERTNRSAKAVDNLAINSYAFLGMQMPKLMGKVWGQNCFKCSDMAALVDRIGGWSRDEEVGLGLWYTCLEGFLTFGYIVTLSSITLEFSGGLLNKNEVELNSYGYPVKLKTV